MYDYKQNRPAHYQVGRFNYKRQFPLRRIQKGGLQKERKKARYGARKGFQTSLFALRLICEEKSKAKPV